MSKRLFLRAGEVPILYGYTKRQSEWSLFNDLVSGSEADIDDYGRWRARLASPIMSGIAEDHGLSVLGAADPAEQVAKTKIMAPKAWRLAVSKRTNDQEAVLLVDQRSSASLYEWKAPAQVPARALVRMRAVAAAYDVGHVMTGILVDGYSTQLFGVDVTDKERADIRAKVSSFIAKVEADEEPELDFADDEMAIRRGEAVAKVEKSAAEVLALIERRDALVREEAITDTQLKHHQQSLRGIDNQLIMIAGEKEAIDLPEKLVTISRSASQVPTVKVIAKTPDRLF